MVKYATYILDFGKTYLLNQLYWFHIISIVPAMEGQFNTM